MQQAYKVAQQIDEGRQQLEILSKMFLYHGNRGEWFICYEMVQEMLRLAETIGEERYLCMAHGSLSSLYLQRGNLPAAFHSYDRFFETALETAHNQSARLLELRAATSLAHLWQSQGKLTEAHLLLTPLYDWFTEGFTTPDLQKAQMVLNKRSLHFCSFS